MKFFKRSVLERRFLKELSFKKLHGLRGGKAAGLKFLEKFSFKKLHGLGGGKTAGLKLLKEFSFKKLSRHKPRPGLAGLYTEERAFLRAAAAVRRRFGAAAKEGSGKKSRRGGGQAPAARDIVCLSPYPVHGLEEAMETPRSWIPYITLIFGAGGCLFGLWLTWWTSVVDWPVIVGGKPHWSLPAFIPVIFELTILFAALGAIGALIYACGLPHISPPVIDPALTSHKFAIFVPFSPEGNEGGERLKSGSGKGGGKGVKIKRGPAHNEREGGAEKQSLAAEPRGEEIKKLFEEMEAEEILKTVF